MSSTDKMKVKDTFSGASSSRAGRYRELYYGDVSTWAVIKAELVTTFTGSVGGALGLFLRSKLYPSLFNQCGRNVIFGRNITIRHPARIRLGNNVIIDDNCLLDAKGTSNEGITIGDNVYIGRNTLVYCKNGNIRLRDSVNISANCTLVSSNDMTIGEGTLIGAYTYLLSGGEYDFSRGAPEFADQDGMKTQGPLTIGSNTWIGGGVTILDSACIGEHCVIGAGAVVTKQIPANSMAVGIPAKVVKSLV